MRTAEALLERMTLSEGTEAVERPSPPTPLTAALIGLALQPFSPASVERYKQEKAKAANAWLWLHRVLLGLPYLAAACFVFGLAHFWAFAIFTSLQHDVQRVCLLTGPAALGVGGLTLILSGLIKVKGRALWEVVPEPEYRGYIPADVALTLCEIEAKLPTVAFVVHRLVQNTKSLDPFIEAQYGDASYVIAVWDEPYTA